MQNNYQSPYRSVSFLRSLLTPVQWYGPVSTTGNIGPKIPGAVNSTYTPVGSETLAAGTYYYNVMAKG
jgi:hypothetical protein